MLWMPVLGELVWTPYEPRATPAATVARQAPPRTLREYNTRRMREDLDTLTETLVELYLEANPAIAQRRGEA